MTHGGGTSVVESIYYGKPMLCLPIAIDQFGSCWRVEDMGAGFSVTEDPSVADIENAVNRIYQNQTKVKKI